MTLDIEIIAFAGIYIVILCIWIYCILFAIKYDRNSYSLLLLFVLNAFYIPFYLYRIRRIKKENSEVEEHLDFDYIKSTRESIIEILEIWSSKEVQFNIQESDSLINVSEELFQQWQDFYKTYIEAFKYAFTESEKKLLIEFNDTLTERLLRIGNNFPTLNEFQNSAEWKDINSFAKRIVNELK